LGNAAGNLTEHLAAVSQIQILGAEGVGVSLTVCAWLELLNAQWRLRQTEIAFSIEITSVPAIVPSQHLIAYPQGTLSQSPTQLSFAKKLGKVTIQRG